MLLAEADPNQARVINEVLESFYNSSEAMVHMTKAKVFFSKNIMEMERIRIGSMLGFIITQDLGKYLGMPLLHSRVTKHTYQEIIDKVDRRLSGWNTSHLSLAGRITLAQSVLQAAYLCHANNQPS